MDVATREYKDIQIENLRRVDVERYQLDTIDVRLLSYISGVRQDSCIQTVAQEILQ